MASENRVRARHQRTLERRRQYLQAQLAATPLRKASADWTKAEAAALGYALAVLDDADAIGLRRLGQLSTAERDQLREAVAGVAAAS